ncbi:hypothetical protein ACFL1X_03265 [Candidatus Hydrogenedentota bacterium]
MENDSTTLRKIASDVKLGEGVKVFDFANMCGHLQAKYDWECIATLVEKGASIGSSATILCGVKIGEG